METSISTGDNWRYNNSTTTAGDSTGTSDRIFIDSTSTTTAASSDFAYSLPALTADDALQYVLQSPELMKVIKAIVRVELEERDPLANMRRKVSDFKLVSNE